MTTKTPNHPDPAQAIELDTQPYDNLKKPDEHLDIYVTYKVLRILIETYISTDTDEIPDNPDIVQAVELCTQGYDNLKESDEWLRPFLVPLLATGNGLLMDEGATVSYVKKMFSDEIGYTYEDLDILVRVLYDRGHVALAQDLAKWAYQKRPKKWPYLGNSALLLLSCGLASTIRRRDTFYHSIRQLPNCSVKALWRLWRLWRSPESMSLPIVDCLSTPPVSETVACDICKIVSKDCIKLSCGHLFHPRCAVKPVLKTWKCPNGCNLRQYFPILRTGLNKDNIGCRYVRR